LSDFFSAADAALNSSILAVTAFFQALLAGGGVKVWSLLDVNLIETGKG